LPGGDLLSKRNMQWRYRRDLSGSKVNKTDFVIKYKEGVPFYPNLKPFGTTPTWDDAYSCKVEDNLKYVVCPNALCFPNPPGECYQPCGTPGGIALEAQEQAPKLKGNPGDPFAEQYTSVGMFKTVADVSALFPDVADHFVLDIGDALTVSKMQYRYINYKVNIEIDDLEIESSFVLFYSTEGDMTAGTALDKGEWSIALEEGDPAWAKQDEALLLLGAVAQFSDLSSSRIVI